MMQKSLRKNPYLLLAGATLLFYLPVASLRFAIKNDLFTGYFPARFHLTSFLQAGMFPLWDPWINYGLPLYGDITAASWSPLTILIASTVGYNAYTMTAEVLLAIFTAGVAMHALCVRFGFGKRSSLYAALAYMACGYFIGDLQHLNWVWGAALLPWCASGFLRYNDSGRWRDLPASLLPFFLFLTIAHPGLMIGAAYFFLFWVIGLCLGLSPQGHGQNSWIPARRAGTLLAALVVVVIGLAYAYGTNLSLTTRGSLAGSGAIGHAASTWPTWISVLLPLATVRSDAFFATDIAVRNAYIGLLPLAFIALAWIFDRNRWTLFWTALVLFFILSSGEHGLSSILNRTLPLMGQVRLKGELRIFAIFGAIILAASQMHRMFDTDGSEKARLRKILRIASIVFAGTAMAATIVMFVTGQSILSRGIFAPSIKGVILSLQPADLVLLQSLVQALLCFGLIRILGSKKNTFRPILLLLMTDLALSAWMNLPFTGVGSRSVADVQTLIARSPAGVPIPSTGRTIDITRDYPHTDSVIGNWGLYAKDIAYRSQAAYPMKMAEAVHFFPDHADSLLNTRLLFRQDGQDLDFNIVSFHPDQIRFRAKSVASQVVYWKQVHHPGWKATVNGLPENIIVGHEGLMGVHVQAGEADITFKFSDPLARWAQVYHFTAFFLLWAMALYHRRNSGRSS